MTQARVAPLASDPIMLAGLSVLLRAEARLSVLPEGRHDEADVRTDRGYCGEICR